MSDFKPVLKILLRFVLIYIALLLLYQLYLNTQNGLDSVSMWVGKQVVAVQNFLGYESKLIPDHRYETAYFQVNGKKPTRMVEGCNAISVMILFLAFVFAFYKGRKTFVFALISLVILHIMNVLRIAGLNLMYFQGEKYFKIGHDYLFPAVIYGSVVILWLVWIKVFVLKDEKAF